LLKSAAEGNGDPQVTLAGQAQNECPRCVPAGWQSFF
jgi:hypothetical protein